MSHQGWAGHSLVWGKVSFGPEATATFLWGDPADDMPLWVSIEHGAIVAHEVEGDAVLGSLHEAWDDVALQVETPPVLCGPWRQHEEPTPKQSEAQRTQAERQRIAYVVALVNQEQAKENAARQAHLAGLQHNWEVLKSMGLVKGELV